MDLYELLRVRRNASETEVRRAYQRLARALHPDLNPGDPVAADRFRTVSRAFEVLSDSERRAAYDRGEASPDPATPLPEGGFEGFDFSTQVRVESVGFREIFDGVLRPSGERPGAEPLRGEDLEQATRVTFEESLAGTDRRVHLVRQEHCPLCQGTGDVPIGPVACPRCQGSGQVRGSRGHMIFSRRCADCGGTGRLVRKPCPPFGGGGGRLALAGVGGEVYTRRGDVN